MRNKTVFWILFGITILAHATPSQAMHIFDNPHFFRANHFFGEPRFEKKGLTSLDIVASGGSSSTVRAFDLICLLTQNLARGFFLQLHAPFRSVDIKRRETQKGIGEVSAYIGWAQNYQNTEKIDFVDTSLKLGIVAPTGGTIKKNHPCEISLGYNGHTGASLGADLSIGAFEWLTLGGHLRTILFAQKEHALCITSSMSSTRILVRPGTIFEAGFYVKADHIVRGLSFLCGYSYDRKKADSCKPCVNTCFLNHRWFEPWKMHTVHYIVEYDFSKEGRMLCPRLSWYYDQQVGGHNVFHVNMAGVGLGIEFVW